MLVLLNILVLPFFLYNEYNNAENNKGSLVILNWLIQLGSKTNYVCSTDLLTTLLLVSLTWLTNNRVVSWLGRINKVNTTE